MITKLMRVLEILYQYKPRIVPLNGSILFMTTPSRVSPAEIDLLKELGAYPVLDHYFELNPLHFKS